MKIAVASGKGGTGKTTVAAALALSVPRPALLLDCDVEEPNAHLLLHPTLGPGEDVALLVPKVDAAACTGCGRCAEVCEFHALAIAGNQVLLFPDLCHGCGGCTLVCPQHAITETSHVIGQIETGLVQNGVGGRLRFAHGRLNIGEAMPGPLIRRLAHEPQPGEITIMDSPPGTGCPVAETVRGADFCLLVTEPTPFGLHDLGLAHDLTRQLGVPAGVVLNRDGIGDQGVEHYCSLEGLPILLRIPFDRRIAHACAEGTPLVQALPESREWFTNVFRQITAGLDGPSRS